MKVTKKSLKDMILKELISTVSGTDQVNRRQIQNRTGPFVMLTQAVFDTLDRLEESIRMSSELEKMDLNGLKNNELQRLRDKISFIEGAIDAKLEGRINNDSSYE